ncbi:hypothetical protein [Novosphingobium sp. P6W]|uniref:hypothetical protein n=1 Tax=Novosphingobium sp. P6W TaxID=1609758 RepID=UPI0005C2FCAA|nr:hypothetical protein [Novosphingobium sp. P6W]AXB80197.1 hypothetical protein TQ38_026765 [Novosphingobium sp. P6W]KIS31552.1 hypothetical protein TQ38_15540 [Novosphingobium sp. P6W]
MTSTQLYAGDVTTGTAVPVCTMDVTYKTAILHVAAGWDYMPGHHEPAYAIAQGTDTIYLNTLFHQSFVDRTLTDWAGPRTFLTRRKISMRDQIYPGDRIEGHARVLALRTEEAGATLVDLSVIIRTPRADACIAECTIRLPERS